MKQGTLKACTGLSPMQRCQIISVYQGTTNSSMKAIMLLSPTPSADSDPLELQAPYHCCHEVHCQT